MTRKTLTIVYESWDGSSLLRMMKALQDISRTGSMVDMILEYGGGREKFGFDGDGSDRIVSIEQTEEKAELSLENLTRAYVLETAAHEWWNQMSGRERLAYVRAHPRSSYSRMLVDAPRSALGDHLKSKGWARKGSKWANGKTGRSLVLRGKGSAIHHIVVTHANGDVSEHPTNSLRAAKRVVSDMSRPSGNRIGGTLSRNAGSLHRTLGVPQGTRIPTRHLMRLASSDHPLARRANLALKLRGAIK